MIRITVELISAKTGKSRTLGIMDICNDASGSATRGNYKGFLYRQGLKTPTRKQVVKEGRVEDFPRKSYSAWRLLLRMLKDMHPEEKQTT